MESLKLFIDWYQTISSVSALKSGLKVLGKEKIYQDVNNLYKRGDIDAKQRIAGIFKGWEGLPVSCLDDIYNSLKGGFFPDAENFLRNKDIRNVELVKIINSNMPRRLQKGFQREYGLYYITGPVLEVKGGYLTGVMLEAPKNKREVVETMINEEGWEKIECVIIGNNKQDFEARDLVGWLVGFNAPKEFEKDLYMNVPHWNRMSHIIERIIEEVLTQKS